MAAIRKTMAEADALVIGRQVVTPEEVARSCYAEGGFSLNTTVDMEARDRLLDTDRLSEDDLAEGVAAPDDSGQTERATRPFRISPAMARETRPPPPSSRSRSPAARYRRRWRCSPRCEGRRCRRARRGS